ncbi:MAG: CotH kinase family protein, partial [Myxococcota bacterium]
MRTTVSHLPRVPVLVGLAFACACGSPAAVPTEPETGTEQGGPGGKADSADDAAKTDFFGDETFYYVRIRGWDDRLMTPESLADAHMVEGAELLIYKSRADSPYHCPDGEVNEADLVYAGEAFSLRTSGNFTNGTPKSSYKIKFKGKSARMYGMRALNLKSMWNDVSQMREALAWGLFEDANLPASRHTYAKFCINDRYYGLYSVIEQVDKSLLKVHFGKNDEGNLYKAYWEDLGPADLSYRVGDDGDDGGGQYFVAAEMDDRTYQLKTNEDEDDDPAFQTYDDLARFIRTIHGVDISGTAPDKLDTTAYRESVETIFDVRGFL